MITLKSKDWEIDNINTVLLDKDGTFIDLHYFWGQMTELRAKEVIKKYSLDKNLFPQICLTLGYDPQTGKMLKDGITAMYSRPIIIEIFCRYLNSIGAKATEKDIELIFDVVSDRFYKNMEKYTKPIDDAIDFIKSIKKHNIKTGIVTSDSKESALLTIKHFGWENLFDVVIGRESTTETKESGVPVKMALEILNSTPETLIMIGDAPMDYIAAKNAGVERTILVASGQIPKNDLLKTSKYSLESLSELVIETAR